MDDILKHDFHKEPTGADADAFLAWLERETIGLLGRTLGDPEGNKTAIFLYVNRAYESHMPESQIGSLFGKCCVRAGRTEEEQDAAFDLLEFFGQIAERTRSTIRITSITDLETQSIFRAWTKLTATF